ncbi:uncharacterized protein LOC132720854 [Ruditapes philippinarum]|uniref:uncharacterized protein LOC132720854 n=1 Tax=Ruditapes philippinarum TaxID=129788 RepID=UPI00295AF0DB|nr:uncharacterized protein LOC132720854 [Ruditapes philippinarum]
MSLSQFRNRGRAYKCKRCTKVQRKGRMVAHILKHHVPFDRVPFACSLCGFRCLDKQALMDHITKYTRHREEESRYGTPDYKKILHMAGNPYQIGDDDMEQLSRDESLRWHARNQIQEGPDDNDCFYEEDEEVVSGGMVLPQWMAGTTVLGKTATAPPSTPAITKPTVRTPLQTLPMLTQHDLAELSYRPTQQLPQQGRTPQQNQQLSHQRQLFTINSNDLLSFQTTTTDFHSNQKDTNNNLMDEILNTPVINRRSPLNTPCLDEIVVQENYANDPLFREDLQSDSSRMEPPTKRQKTTTDREQQTEDQEAGTTPNITKAISDAAKLIADAINCNTSAVQSNEKALHKIGDELVRVERKLFQIERVCTIMQQQQHQQQEPHHNEHSENKENKKSKQAFKSVVKKCELNNNNKDVFDGLLIINLLNTIM